MVANPEASIPLRLAIAVADLQSACAALRRGAGEPLAAVTISTRAGDSDEVRLLEAVAARLALEHGLRAEVYVEPGECSVRFSRRLANGRDADT